MTEVLALLLENAKLSVLVSRSSMFEPDVRRLN